MNQARHEQNPEIEATVDANSPSTQASAHTKDAVPREGEQVRYFGEYELLEEIARGGMGVVFKARQVKLNRVVALKMILSGELAGTEEVQRFQTEAEAAANLDHAGIVPIYEIGDHDGQHYFSMGFVDGQSLAEKLQDGPLPPREAATTIRKVAAAVAYAHGKGVIHRDLKPANVLLDLQDEPKVTDFGLAKQIESDSDLTRTGAVMGTPSYMSPEQASGNTNNIGPRSDVYSLGAILYCLLTGRPPFQSAKTMDVLLQVVKKDPVSLRVLNPDVPKDLETICLKCLEKDPDRRYDAAGDLEEDLRRYLDGEPVLAQPPSLPYRVRKYVARHKLLVSAAGTISALLIGGTVVLFLLMQSRLELTQAELREARDAAKLQRLGALEITDKQFLHVRTLPISFGQEDLGCRIFVPAGKSYRFVTHVGNLPGTSRLPQQNEGAQLPFDLPSFKTDREVIAIVRFQFNPEHDRWEVKHRIIDPANPSGLTVTPFLPPAYSRYFTVKQAAKEYASVDGKKTHMLTDNEPYLRLAGAIMYEYPLNDRGELDFKGQSVGDWLREQLRKSPGGPGFLIWIEPRKE